MLIRDATAADAAACAAIYAPYVRDTAITFEADPPDAAVMAERIRAAQHAHAWVVAEDGDSVVGYAYGVPYKTRSAYRWSSEVTVYLDERSRGRGVGRALYVALIPRLVGRGIRMLVAGITEPNPPSEALHRSLGFERSGVLRRIGFKHGAWRDVALWQRAVGSEADPTAEPRSGQETWTSFQNAT